MQIRCVSWIKILNLFFRYCVFSSDFSKQYFISFNKERMPKAFLVLSVTWFMKIIHIQLSNKGTKVVVFKIFGQNIFCKSVRIFNNKAVTLLVPKNSVLILSILKRQKLHILKLTLTISNVFIKKFGTC